MAKVKVTQIKSAIKRPKESKIDIGCSWSKRYW